MNSTYLLLDPDGNEAILDKNSSLGCINKTKPALAALIGIILHGEMKSAPNYMRELKQLEWINYEPASDKGHFRFYPKGALVFSLLREWLRNMAVELFGALEVMTPFLYDWDREDIRGQAGIFANRIYHVCCPDDERQNYALRFNGDVGLFQIMKDAQLTYKHLPVRLFENCMGFRYSQSGELSGIRRARAFSFPDIHSFCADVNQGMIEYERLFELTLHIAQELGIEVATLFKVPQSFYSQIKAHLVTIAKLSECPLVVEIIPGQKQYWVMKHITYTSHSQKLFHIQLDLEDGERYGVGFQNSDGLRKPCVVVHTSIGSIERWMLIAVADALAKSTPAFPLWLSPVQVRILSVKDGHNPSCVDLASSFKMANIRADVDDRSIALNRKIKSAEKEWIPYIIVFGEKEQREGILSVRMRSQGQKRVTPEALIDEIKNMTIGMPFMPYGQLLISKTPVFRGGRN